MLALAILAALAARVAFFADLEDRSVSESSSESPSEPETYESMALPAAELPVETGWSMRLVLGADEKRTWTLRAAPDHFVLLTVTQRGVDVRLWLVDPSGEQVLVADRPIDDHGEETILFVTSSPDPYLLIMHAAGHGGEVNVRVDAAHPASEEDRRRSRAAQAFSRAEELSWQGQKEAAIDAYRRVLDAWRKLGDVAWEAETRERLGRAHADLFLSAEAETHHAAAAELFGRLDDARWQAICLHYLGLDLFRQGRPGEAIKRYRQALPLRRRAGDRHGEAITLHSLAQAHQMRDEIQLSLDANTAALSLLEETRDPYLRAHTIHNLGVLYATLGERNRAARHLRAAVAAWKSLERLDRQASSLNQLGELRLESASDDTRDAEGASDAGNERAIEEAEASFRVILGLRRQVGDRRGEASTLANLGRVHQRRGELDLALAAYLEAERILAGLDHPQSEARVLLLLGDLALTNRTDEAAQRFRRAGELYRSVGDLTGEAESQAGLARAERLGLRFASALEASGRALDLVEQVRPRALSFVQRAKFFARAQTYFDLHISLLLDLHHREPAAGHDAAALLVAERARARSLLDLLWEREGRQPAAGDPVLLASEDELTRRLASLDRARLRRAEGAGGGARSAALEDLELEDLELRDLDEEIDRILDRLDDVRTALRAGDATVRRLTGRAPASLDEIRRAATAGGSVLVEYWLGEERSVRWVLSADGLETALLPPRREIEPLALRVHVLLGQSHRREARAGLHQALCDLSEILLGSALSEQGDARLTFVPDGALHYLPFAVLPWKGTDGDKGGGFASCDGEESRVSFDISSSLVWRHEIVAVPSAGILATLLAAKERGAPAGSLAVIADPVFSAADPRLGVVSSAAESSPAAFRRLASSAREAQAILDLAPSAARLRLLGFDADKERVMAGALRGYRHLHFATHGVLDTEHPELSGIVLSQVDPQGRPRDGILRTLDLFRLDLDAELVVLSACETALGEEVRGEGLMGLARGFLAAGAESLVVSLWKVSDHGTAELMTSFYRARLQGGLRPSAALRLAQLDMARRSEYAEPYFWAGFVAVGSGRRLTKPDAADGI